MSCWSTASRPTPDTVKRLQDHVKATIAPYKYPRSVKFIDALPKTQTGKIQRFALRTAAAATLDAGKDAMTTQPKPARMTADEFLAWAEGISQRPIRARQRRRRADAGGACRPRRRQRVLMFKRWPILQDCDSGALRGMVDGMAVRIDDATIYEPRRARALRSSRYRGTRSKVADPSSSSRSSRPSFVERGQRRQAVRLLLLPPVRRPLSRRRHGRARPSPTTAAIGVA